MCINDKLSDLDKCQVVSSRATRFLNVLMLLLVVNLKYACVVWSPHTVKDVNLFRDMLQVSLW